MTCINEQSNAVVSEATAITILCNELELLYSVIMLIRPFKRRVFTEVDILWIE